MLAMVNSPFYGLLPNAPHRSTALDTDVRTLGLSPAAWEAVRFDMEVAMADAAASLADLAG